MKQLDLFPQKPKQLLAIIDGSNLWYRCYWIAPFKPNRLASMSYEKSLRDVGATHAVVVFDSKEGDLLRKGIDPTYKANRRKKPEKEIQLMRQFRKSLRAPVVTVKGRDGDDVMYTLAMMSPMPSVIVTADKDMLSAVYPVRGISVYCAMKKQFYRTEKDVIARIGVRPQEVANYLALVGDEVDNVGGLEGIGAVKAKKIIASGDIEGHPLVRDRVEAYKHALRLTTLQRVSMALPSLKDLEL